MLHSLPVYIPFLMSALISTGARHPSSAPVCPPIELSSKELTPSLARASRCYSVEFKSRLLKRNIPFTVIVPRGTGERRGPLPYALFLHGRGGDETSLASYGALFAMEDYVHEGGAPFLIFAPAGGTHYWMNAAISKERWGDMVTSELVDFIESHFAVQRDRPKRRALFGISMGAAGALHLGLKNPKEFGSAYLLSPVFRTEKEIWHPGSSADLPKEDYDSFGTGEQFLARSPRELCRKATKPDGTCLPFTKFRLDIGERDWFLDNVPDTRVFVEELAASHPKFKIRINRCEGPQDATDRDAHSGTYWSCMMPSVIHWLGGALTEPVAPLPVDESQ